jgi:hypothetical protein
MNAYSLWEQGRDLASGQIVSMTPFNPSNGGGLLGSVPLGGSGMALSAVAQFGIYFEMRRMNHLKEAEFEERRHGWINDIASQWIDEHKHTSGIRRDVTMAVSRECQKMWEKLCKNELIDVPQSVLLQISRMTEFLEWNYAIAASAANTLVKASGSDVQWILEPTLNSESIATEMVRTHAQDTKEKKGEWWSGPLKVLGGLPMFLIPVVGPYGTYAATGYGLAEIHDFLTTTHVDFEILRDKVALVQFGIAAERLEIASRQIDYLLEQQEFRKLMRFAASENDARTVDFLLEPVTAGSWFRKEKISLKPITVPRQLP